MAYLTRAQIERAARQLADMVVDVHLRVGVRGPDPGAAWDLAADLARLSPLIHVSWLETNGPDGADGTLALALADAAGADRGVWFRTVPQGLEVDVLVQDVVDLSRGRRPVSPLAAGELARLRRPLLLEVLVAPDCPRCAHAAALAHRLAMAAGGLKAAVVDAGAMPSYLDRFRVGTVPYFVVGGRTGFAGPLPELVLVQRLVQAAAAGAE
ncbi:thioredoxin family protein [Caldinitratiruptor microaerophilus]|uniref:Thioredoxin-like fold domain-containing protein n=1 Tax=Caldinitratiruptor microaerophilus TaxID=671077 RepID=A0AA35CKD6_9FIRM|nr:thioredoxin family protein [Caldinitratiruptor microaerophilus]BDG60028.1 hypothetical protein caldi_11180 [Caldinitratiruptor microaerophilus]